MARLATKKASARPLGRGAKWVWTCFLSAFFAGGAFFSYLIIQDLWETTQPYFWTTVECEILSSTIQERAKEERPYSVQVRYRYLWNERTFTSEQLSRKPQPSSDYGKIQRLVHRFEAGSKTFCYVNPDNPRQAVLLRDGLWFGFSLVVPLVFMLFGGGGIYVAWRTASFSPPDGQRSEALSANAPKPNNRGCLVIFFGVFFLAGGFGFYQLTLRPLLKILAAGDWIQTPCVVESSRVRSHRGEDSTTYSVEILYRYVFHEREYKSNRYHFMRGSSSGHKGKAAVVRRYPPGMETVCFVNPKDPTEAVLERGVTADLWFGLIPLVFVMVGAGGMFFAMAKFRRQQKGWASGGASSLPDQSRGGSSLASAGGTDGPIVLKARHSPWGKLLGTIFLALFWNGILSVFVWQVIQAWRRPGGSGMEKWFLPIFLIPFILVGLFFIGLVFYYLLGLFNPRIQLTANTGRIALGDLLRVHWRITGRIHVLQRLRVYLEGQEEATYTRGTKTHTDKAVFAKIDLANTTTRNEFRSGEGQVTLPLQTMPTFEAAHNKILWSIHVKGEIARWPDLDEQYPVTIVPPKTHPPPSP